MNSTQLPVLIVVMGPTASGKTGLAISLAQHFGAEIFSCDARQFYRELEIGTAKPNEEELAAVPHHFINSHSIHEDFSAGAYERAALDALDTYFLKKKTAILVGGSGMYVRMLCEGVDQFPELPDGIRENLQKLFEEQGIEALQAELKLKDPVYYQKVDLQNHQRLIRALEVCRGSGQPYSSFLNQPKVKRNFRVLKMVLDWPREQLYERINKRVDLMLEAGLEAEARKFYPLRQLNALQTVGYQEWNGYFEGKITREEAIELIKRNSRRYAKRQLTWCRKEKGVIWIHPITPWKEIIKIIERKLQNNS